MSHIYRLDNQEAIASNVLNYASASTVNLNNGSSYTPIFQAQSSAQHQSVISTHNDASNNLSYASAIPVESALNQGDSGASRALQSSASFLLPQNRSMTSLVANSNQNGNGNYGLHDASSSFGLSAVEAAILRSTVPIDINETEEITVNGERGIWANKSEVCCWRGELPLNQYQINEDSNPEVITKRSTQSLQYIQELAIRYLRPPTPPAPGEIVISQQANFLTPPAPPVVLRQQPPRPATPEPLVIREAPPMPPCPVGRKVITISGKRIPPPPRKVVIERLAPIPTKPQSVIIERWLPYSEVKRRVIFQKSQVPDPVVVKPKNVIVQWEAPPVQVKKEFKYLGIIRANPADYVARYGPTLKTASELPEFVLDIKPPSGVILAADYKPSSIPELEGDVHALGLIDLDKEGLSEYRSQLLRLSNNSHGNNYQNSNLYVDQNGQTGYTRNLSYSTTKSYSYQTPQLIPQQQQPTTSKYTSPNVFNPDCSEYHRPGGCSGSSNVVQNNSSSVVYSTSHIQQANSASSSAWANPKIDNSNEDLLRKIFDLIDIDENGRIKYDEAHRILCIINEKFNRNNTDDTARRFLHLFDRHRDGTVDFEEFKQTIRVIINS